MSDQNNHPCENCISAKLIGEAIVAFATVTEANAEEEDELIKELRTLVRGEIGPFAAPDIICITPLLPMVCSPLPTLHTVRCKCDLLLNLTHTFALQTRSGKIMRRVLRKILAGEADQLGDVSTLADPSVVDTLIDLVRRHDT